MSNKPATPGQAFVSHDGEGSEVWVQKGVGNVVNINMKQAKNSSTNNRVAQVEIQTPGLEFPQKAWINESAPQFAAIQKAYDEGTPIEYRIEAQRKKKNTKTNQPIPKETPITELRADTATAIANVNSILVGVNGDLTDERLTHPDADPAPSGRVPAKSPNQTQAPVQNQAPQNRPQNGPQNGNRNAVVEEEAPWREFNSDGSRNLGSYSVLAAFSMESFTYKALAASGRDFSEQDVALFGRVIMAIADKIHAWVTRKGRPDRMANSHSRVRGVVIDTIENILPIPADNKQVDEWVKQVGKIALARFNAGMEIVVEPFDLSRVNEALGLESAAPQGQQASQPQAQAPQSQQSSQPQAQAQQAPKTQAERQAAAKSLVETLERTKPPAMTMDDTAPASNNPLAGNTPAFRMFPPVEDLPPLTEENTIDRETMEGFKELVNSAGADYAKLRKLLIHTFKVEKASEVPVDDFLPFFEFYEESGKENFLKSLDYVDTIIP